MRLELSLALPVARMEDEASFRETLHRELLEAAKAGVGGSGEGEGGEGDGGEGDGGDCPRLGAAQLGSLQIRVLAVEVSTEVSASGSGSGGGESRLEDGEGEGLEEERGSHGDHVSQRREDHTAKLEETEDEFQSLRDLLEEGEKLLQLLPAEHAEDVAGLLASVDRCSWPIKMALQSRLSQRLAVRAEHQVGSGLLKEDPALQVSSSHSSEDPATASSSAREAADQRQNTEVDGSDEPRQGDGASGEMEELLREGCRLLEQLPPQHARDVESLLFAAERSRSPLAGALRMRLARSAVVSPELNNIVGHLEEHGGVGLRVEGGVGRAELPIPAVGRQHAPMAIAVAHVEVEGSASGEGGSARGVAMLLKEQAASNSLPGRWLSAVFSVDVVEEERAGSGCAPPPPMVSKKDLEEMRRQLVALYVKLDSFKREAVSCAPSLAAAASAAADTLDDRVKAAEKLVRGHMREGYLTEDRCVEFIADSLNLNPNQPKP